jgi:hypothetical protein
VQARPLRPAARSVRRGWRAERAWLDRGAATLGPDLGVGRSYIGQNRTGCGKRATFGVRGTSVALYCAAHKVPRPARALARILLLARARTLAPRCLTRRRRNLLAGAQAR